MSFGEAHPLENGAGLYGKGDFIGLESPPGQVDRLE